MKKSVIALAILMSTSTAFAGDWSGAFKELKQGKDSSVAHAIYQSTFNFNKQVTYNNCQEGDCYTGYRFELTNNAKKGVYKGVPKQYQADMSPAILDGHTAHIKLNNATLWGKPISTIYTWATPDSGDIGFVVEFGKMTQSEYSQFKKSVKFGKYAQTNECSESNYPADIFQDDDDIVYLGLDWGC